MTAVGVGVEVDEEEEAMVRTEEEEEEEEEEWRVVGMRMGMAMRRFWSASPFNQSHVPRASATSSLRL